jgi:hypothetical protein
VQSLGLSVAIVDHDAIELNGRVDHAQLQKMKASVRAAYLDVIVIVLTIYVCLAQVHPSSLSRSQTAKQR